MSIRRLAASLKSRAALELGAGVILVALTVVVLAYIVNASNLQKGNLDVKVGKISVKMNVEKDVTSMRAFLDKIFNDKEARREARALLAEFYDEYSPQDKEKFVDAVSRLNAKDSVSGDLKTLCHRQLGPFKEELQEVRISFPTGPGFADGEAVVCSGSPLFDRRITLYNGDARSITLNANHMRPCAPTQDGQLENIQITKSAARSIFGARPFGKYEKALVGLSN